MRLDKSGKLLFATLAAAVLVGAFGAKDRDIRKAAAAINRVIRQPVRLRLRIPSSCS